LPISFMIMWNRKKMVSALNTPEEKLIAQAIFVVSPNESSENKRPINIKSGAPAGWLTSSFEAERINSLQSQKLVVGSRVSV